MSDDPWTPAPPKKFGGMTEDELEDLVERVSKKVTDNFYQEVGRGVVDKIVKFIGIVAVALLTWAGATGKLGGPS